MGVEFEFLEKEDFLFIKVKGSKKLKLIEYILFILSVQVKFVLIFVFLKVEGKSVIKESFKLRDYIELMLKYVGVSIKSWEKDGVYIVEILLS